MKTAVAVIAWRRRSCRVQQGPVHEENASVEQVANAVRQSGVASDVHAPCPANGASPGTMEEFNIPGMPPEAAVGR